MDRFWQYVSECLRILYWAFFKPFTFRKWLREEVHPDLRLDTNPFELQAEFATNHRLRRYAGQVMAVSAYAPVVITIMTGIIYSFFNSKPFDWYPSSLFLVSWIVGLWIRRIGKSIFKNIFYDLSIGFLIFWIISNFGGKIFPAFAGIEMVAFGVAYGVAVGVAVDVAVGVSWILGVLRVYFWVPEVLWTILLWLFAPRHKLASYLTLLPPYFDEETFLPLPFADAILVEAYKQSPDRVQATLDYLLTSTKQQKLAATVMLQISADSLIQCQTLNDITATVIALDWIPNSPQVGDSLPTLLEIAQDVRSANEASSAYRQSEALNKPIQRLDRLKKTIALDRAATRSLPASAKNG